jgi:hypothetical protein
MDVFLKVGDFEVFEHCLIPVSIFFERRSFFLNPLAAGWLHAHAAKKAAGFARGESPLVPRIKPSSVIFVKKGHRSQV